jgi:hypothetical protein
LAGSPPLVITQEVVLAVDFVLAARPGTALELGVRGRRPPERGPAVPELAARARARRGGG